MLWLAGNVNPAAYRDYPDHKLPLTDKGLAMAQKAGTEIDAKLTELFGEPGPHTGTKLYLSPFIRTRQTAEGVLDGEEGGRGVRRWLSTMEESALLVEQDWGLFEGSGITDAPKKYPNEWKRVEDIRKHQGKFWCRFPLGESCFDVCCRVNQIFGKIQRDRYPDRGHRLRKKPIRNVVIVSHGVTIRAFVMMWCKFSPEWFDGSANPPNASVRVLDSTVLGWDAGYIFPGFGHQGQKLDFDQLSPCVDRVRLDYITEMLRTDTHSEFELGRVSTASPDSPTPVGPLPRFSVGRIAAAAP